jgi:uracil-DNA glycosylase family 4
MAGFFDIPKEKISRRGKTCASCGLYAKVKSPRMPAYGEFKKKILVIGEIPEEKDDLYNKPFQGRYGLILQNAFRKLEYSLFEDCLLMHAVQCRTVNEDGDSRPPTSDEIICCKSRVFATIKEYKPHVIILLGTAALESVIGSRWQSDFGSLSQWRGWTIPDREFNAWICPIFDPSYIDKSEKEVETVWMQDLDKALSMTYEPLPDYEDEKELVEIIDDPERLKELKSPVAFDFETTGLKPHAEGHQIVCTSVSDGNHHYVFLMTDEMKRGLIRLLRNPNIAKIAQNMKFENTWAKIRLDCEVRNWLWDPMLASHILDNRSNITGLKFQAYVQFGILDYSSEIKPYLEADKKDANSFNRVLELMSTESGKKKLLIYCGIDSILEHRLALKQMEEFNGTRST